MMQNAAIGIVEDPSRKKYFLWVKRRDLPIWVLPGGGIDPGETPEEAVTREIYEESGLITLIVRKTAEYTPINKWTALTHVYLCKLKKGILKTTPESVEVGFYPIESPPYPHFPMHLNWLHESQEATSIKIIQRPLKEFSWTKVLKFFFIHPLILIKYLWIRMNPS